MGSDLKGLSKIGSIKFEIDNCNNFVIYKRYIFKK